MSFETDSHLLHLLAGSKNITALDAAKQILDNGTRQVNEIEPKSGLTPLHVAAAWDNLAMCQLLLHYGAEINALDFKKRAPVQLAVGKTRRFLKKLSPHKRPRDRKRILRLISYLFGKNSEGKKSSTENGSCFIVRRRSSPPPPYPYKPEDVSLASLFKKIRILKESPARLSSHEVDDKHDVSLNADKLQIDAYTTNNHENENMGPSFSQASNSTSKCLYPQLPAYSDISSKKISSDHELFVTADEGENSDDTGRESEGAPIQIPSHISNLTVTELKQRLQTYGVEVGPINRDTRKFYDKRLFMLEQQQTNFVTFRKTSKYSKALERMMNAEERNECIDMGLLEENEIRNEFCIGSPIKGEKNEASYFCYLLIDPSKISMMQSCTFRDFISAIFYVGKGKRSRPLQHLCDAVKHRQFDSKEASDKLGRILHLWDRGFGVISLHIFFNIHSSEAFIREGAMIEAVGRDNLTNVKTGEFYGVSRSWNLKQKTEFGARLLRNAYFIFKHERCRPLMENELGH